MSKYAVLISGQPRNVLECFTGIKNAFLGLEDRILKPNSYPDVFIHSWVDPKMEGKRYTANWRKKEIVYVQNQILGLNKNPEDYDDRASNPIPKNVDQIILDVYKPKKWLFETPKEFNYDKRADEYRVKYLDANDSLSFFYSMHMANKLKREYELDNGFVYDSVMRIRFDNVFYQTFNISEYDNKKLMYVPFDFVHEQGIADRWALSSSKNMDIYTDIYPNLTDFVINDKVSWQNENALGYWIRKKNKIPIEIIPKEKIDYVLFRHGNTAKTARF